MSRLDIIKDTPYSINCDVLLKDFKWLIEQAELTEVWQLNLLGTTTLLDETIVSLEVMAMRNARLREALQGVLTADSCFKGTMVSRIYAMREIAKSALEETK